MPGTHVPESELPLVAATGEAPGLSAVEPRSETVDLTGEPANPPALAGAAAASGRGRRRWLLGGGIAVAAVAVGIWAILILSARPLPEALRYLPGDSVIVVELRPELPGDQRAHLGNLLAHFPGFADQSSLSEKLDEVLARLVNAASNGGLDYATRVKPLLAGPLVMAMGATDLAGMTRGGSAARALVVMTTDGKVDCDTIFGSTGGPETYRALELRSVGKDALCAMDGKFLLLGSASGVHAGIDAKLAGSGIDANGRYRTARAALDGDQLGTLFVDGTKASDLITSAMASSGVTLKLPSGPEWAMVGVRILDDAVSLELRTAPIPETATATDLPTRAPVADSRFAAILPPDTLGYLELHGVGASVQRGVAALRDNPGTSAAVGQIEQRLAVVGGLDNLVGWIEELGIAVFPIDTGRAGIGGAVLVRGDAGKVEVELAQLRNLLVLASIGTDITVHESDHAGTAISTVDLGDLGVLGNALGIPGLGSGVSLKFDLAARDGVLMFSVGDGVAEKLLDVSAGAALGSTSSYQAAVRLAGTPNNAQLYLALDGFLGWAEAHLPADLIAGPAQSLRPYLDHLAALAASRRSTSAGERDRLVLTVK